MNFPSHGTEAGSSEAEEDNATPSTARVPTTTDQPFCPRLGRPRERYPKTGNKPIFSTHYFSLTSVVPRLHISPPHSKEAPQEASDVTEVLWWVDHQASRDLNIFSFTTNFYLTAQFIRAPALASSKVTSSLRAVFLSVPQPSFLNRTV